MVTGWIFKYTAQSFSGALSALEGVEAFDANFGATAAGNTLWQLAAMGVTIAIMVFGVGRGIEKANKVMTPLFFVLSLYFYWFIGNILEREWGNVKFTVFYLAGFLLTLLAGAAASLLGWWIYLDMFYVNMSMFFAFATLYPDMQVLFFFIIPVKVKWLAWLDAAMYAIRCAMYIAGGSWVMCLLPLAAVANYLLFFWSDIMERFGRVKYRASRQTINFKQAAKKAQQQKGYIHKCAVCGKTDTDYPDEEFRYCSKCNGYYCYCSEHIHNHVHIE